MVVAVLVSRWCRSVRRLAAGSTPPAPRAPRATVRVRDRARRSSSNRAERVLIAGEEPDRRFAVETGLQQTGSCSRIARRFVCGRPNSGVEVVLPGGLHASAMMSARDSEAHARVRRLGLPRLGAAARSSARSRASAGSVDVVYPGLGPACRRGPHRRGRPCARAGRERARGGRPAGRARRRRAQCRASRRRRRRRRRGSADGFHARFSARSRSYRYRVLAPPDAFTARGAPGAPVASPVDEGALAAAASPRG